MLIVCIIKKKHDSHMSIIYFGLFIYATFIVMIQSLFSTRSTCICVRNYRNASEGSGRRELSSFR